MDGFFPDVAKSTACTYKALQSFNGTVKPKLIFSDNSGEIIDSCEQLGYSHDTCTPHRHQSNGVAERCNRRCKEGTACQLVQSGFMAAWWHLAMRHYCFLYNVTEKCVNRGPWPTLDLMDDPYSYVIDFRKNLLAGNSTATQCFDFATQQFKHWQNSLLP